MSKQRRNSKRLLGMVSLAVLSACAGTTSVRAQNTPTSEPFGSKPATAPAQVPAPAIPSPVPAAPVSREAELEARLRQMEAMVDRLSRQVDQLSSGAQPADPAPAPAAAGAGAGGGGGGGGGAMAATPSASGGALAPGQSLPPNPPPSARFQVPATLENKPAKAKFGPGFEIRSEDDEFIFQFHNLTQVDYRGYQQGGQNPVHDTFVVPRQWFMFSGRVTKQFGYFVSLAHGFDTVTGLDYFADISYDPRLQFRIGRMKTPFTYEFLVEPIQGLISPERSIFFNNFAQNRDTGVMAFGRIFDKKVDYAVGVYNNSRNGFVSLTDGKAVSAFVNYKPFGGEENTLLENFNIGGSVFTGNGSNIPIPQVLRTSVATTGNPVLGVPFLSFNNNVRESGYHTFWDLHMAYYYEHLSLIAEWASGNQSYAPANMLSSRTRVPVQSFYVQSGYFLTGEKASSVGIVKPLKPFDLREGKRGFGAIELTGRYAYLDVGRQVFTDGLADQNLWSNRVGLLDAGVNWHLNQYIKVMLDWQHAEFGSPVQFAPGRRQLTSDLFWLRMQLYF